MQTPTEPNPVSLMPAGGDRRRGADRRRRTLHALMIGTLRPRRRSPRRTWDRSVVATDWYRPQWLAAALLIVIFSMADALLTLTLLHRGALEANPIMAAFLAVDPIGFVPAKIALTGIGVALLTVASRVRAFRFLPVSVLLYGLLGAYTVLISYEIWLLGKHPSL